MARPREFDTETALAGAMNVFWEQGYENASLPDLLEGMGITRGSLYKAFTDKKTLFLTILDQYNQVAVQPAIAVLSGSTDQRGIDRIETVFSSVLNSIRDGDRRGCLLCTAAAGPAMEDVEICAAVGDMLVEMRGGFDQALRATGKTIPGMSEMLLTQYVGLRIMTRSQVPLSILENSYSALMATLMHHLAPEDTT